MTDGVWRIWLTRAYIAGMDMQQTLVAPRITRREDYTPPAWLVPGALAISALRPTALESSFAEAAAACGMMQSSDYNADMARGGAAFGNELVSRTFEQARTPRGSRATERQRCVACSRIGCTG